MNFDLLYSQIISELHMIDHESGCQHKAMVKYTRLLPIILIGQLDIYTRARLEKTGKCSVVSVEDKKVNFQNNCYQIKYMNHT